MSAAASLERAVVGVADRLLGRALGLRPWYAGGWGDEAVIADLVGLLERGTFPDAPPVTLGAPQAIGGLLRHAGELPSPGPVAALLPDAARTARFELWLPPGRKTVAGVPVCLFLAATGEEGYATRRRLAVPLVHAGVACIILENAYYGSRRGVGQRSFVMPRILDQLVMNGATVFEAQALLAWAEREGATGLAVTGYSLGGFMSATVAAVYRQPLAVVPAAAGASASPLFVEGALRSAVAWDALVRTTAAEAETRFLDLFAAVATTRLSAPVRPDAAIVVGATGDGIVPEAEVRALHAHWPGSELRWVRGGHLGGLVLGGAAIRTAILDALRRL